MEAGHAQRPETGSPAEGSGSSSGRPGSPVGFPGENTSWAEKGGFQSEESRGSRLDSEGGKATRGSGQASVAAPCKGRPPPGTRVPTPGAAHLRGETGPPARRPPARRPVLRAAGAAHPMPAQPPSAATTQRPAAARLLRKESLLPPGPAGSRRCEPELCRGHPPAGRS